MYNTPESATRVTPGIVVLTGRFAAMASTEDELNAVLRRGYGVPVQATASARLGDWLCACLVAGRNTSASHHTDGSGITVLLDGYITDVSPPGADDEPVLGLCDAEIVARLYLRYGGEFLARLRGSFLGTIIDRERKVALVFNDRTGSRPMFRRTAGSHSSCFAPQTRFLSRIEPTITALDATAVGEFLIRGCFYGTDTLFDGIEKLPQASSVVLSRDGAVERQYWSLRYRAPTVDREEALLEEFDAVIRQATRRLLGCVRNPALLLSGGLDSRLMLGYLQLEGATLPSFSYAVTDCAGDDHTVADRIAQHLGLAHELYSIDFDDFEAASVKEAIAADGRVQIIDAPSSRWEHIGSHFSGMFIGDECFGWKEEAESSEAALDIVGWWNVDAAPRVSDWLKPDKLREIREGIAGWRKALVDETADADSDNIKDALYYRERMGNMLNGFSARRLAVAEQARPFLDEDVIEFLAGVPARLRRNKLLARKLMRLKFPVLNEFPYAERTSVPWGDRQFVALVSANAAIHRFIVGELTDRLDPRLAECFDTERLRSTAVRFFSGEKLPPLRRSWWSSMPGAWRLAPQPQDRVGTLRSLLRVLQINLFLTR